MIMKKNMVIILLILLSVSCVTTKQSSLPEEELFRSRKYVGNFIEYRLSESKHFGDPNLIWIKTTMSATYGKISAYSKECRFPVGDRLYIRRIYMMPGGISGYWIYQIESNDGSITYRLSDFQYDNKKQVQSLF
jgi:hypothetical protein